MLFFPLWNEMFVRFFNVEGLTSLEASLVTRRAEQGENWALENGAKKASEAEGMPRVNLVGGTSSLQRNTVEIAARGRADVGIHGWAVP